jgi:hypothetical protein
MVYADQVEMDYQILIRAVKSGSIPVEMCVQKNYAMLRKQL